jgi:hypothetical protein
MRGPAKRFPGHWGFKVAASTWGGTLVLGLYLAIAGFSMPTHRTIWRASNQRDFEYDFDSQTRNPRRAREGRCAADKSFAGDREALEVPGRKGNAADETD